MKKLKSPKEYAVTKRFELNDPMANCTKDDSLSSCKILQRQEPKKSHQKNNNTKTKEEKEDENFY